MTRWLPYRDGNRLTKVVLGDVEVVLAKYIHTGLLCRANFILLFQLDLFIFNSFYIYSIHKKIVKFKINFKQTERESVADPALRGGRPTGVGGLCRSSIRDRADL